mgnify:CR=1 FL=1
MSFSTVSHEGYDERQGAHDSLQPNGNWRFRSEEMNRPLVAAGLVVFAFGPYSSAQDTARAAEPTAKPKTAPSPKASTNPLSATENNGQPITTEIYADEASFNTEKRVGVFNGHVRVFDPRFHIQSDKLTVFIHKEEGEGLEKAIAEKNVGVVRESPIPKESAVEGDRTF